MSHGEASRTAALTPLGPRLSSVWLTYRTRPLAWLMLLIYTAVAGGGIYALRDRRPPYEEWIAQAGKQDTSQLRAQRSSWDQQQRQTAAPRRYQPEPRIYFAPPEIRDSFNRGKTIDPKDVRTVEIWNEKDIPAEFWEPGAYPQVKAIIAFSEPLSSATVQRLLETFEIQAFYFNRSETMTREDLQALADESRLQHLALDNVPPFANPEALSWPKNLRSLSITAYGPLSIQRFQEWRTLSRLDTLNLNLPADLQPTLYAPEIVAELEQFPRRPMVFLDVPEGSDGKWAVAAQSHFRSIAVRPKMVSKSRTLVAMYAFLLLLLPTGFALLQLSVQSLQPVMLLAPGAMGPHQKWALRLWVFGGLFSAVFAWLHGVAGIAALAIGVSGMLFYGAQLRFVQRSRGVERVGFAHPLMVALPILFIPAGIMVFGVVVKFIPTVAGEIDWFLRGQYPSFAMLLFGVGVASGWYVVTRLVFTRRQAEEAGLADVPLSAVDFAGWNRAVAPMVAKNQERLRSWHPILQNRERRLEALAQNGPALTRSQRVRVWLCGLWMHPSDFTMLLMAICLVQFAVLIGMRALGLGTAEDRGMILIPATQMLMMFLMVPVWVLWSRRKWMAHELLFPVSRRNWIRDWFLVQARMFLPVVWLVILFVFVDGLLGWVVRPTIQELVFGTLGLVFALVTMWALTLQIATWSARRILITAGAILLVWIVAVALIVWLDALNNDAQIDAFISAPATIITAVVVALVALVGLIVWTHRRWQTWEVGQLN